MKTFRQWAEEKKLDLPVYSEEQSRNAVRPWAYPELYGRGQYPQAWFRPKAADAVTYEKDTKVAPNAFSLPKE